MKFFSRFYDVGYRVAKPYVAGHFWKLTATPMKHTRTHTHTHTHTHTWNAHTHMKHTRTHTHTWNTPQWLYTARVKDIGAPKLQTPNPWCNTLLHQCYHLGYRAANMHKMPEVAGLFRQLTTTHYNTLQHTATHCNTLQHTPWLRFRVLLYVVPEKETHIHTHAHAQT